MSQTISAPENNEKLGFLAELRQQRWDDHRYYHHSRINQSLHLLSATSFLASYVLIVFDPGTAVLLAWIIAMSTRQIGHFFFEPKTYDDVNDASFQHKEDIKIGYNLHRKRVLQTIWALSPIGLYFNPTFFGFFEAHANVDEYLYNLAFLWLFLGAGALLFRTIHLFFIHDVQTGLVWATKILTDPFNDFKQYFRSPFYLMRGELIDPMTHVRHGLESEETEPAELATQR